MGVIAMDRNFDDSSRNHLVAIQEEDKTRPISEAWPLVLVWTVIGAFWLLVYRYFF